MLDIETTPTEVYISFLVPKKFVINNRIKLVGIQIWPSVLHFWYYLYQGEMNIRRSKGRFVKEIKSLQANLKPWQPRTGQFALPIPHKRITALSKIYVDFTESENVFTTKTAAKGFAPN